MERLINLVFHTYYHMDLNFLQLVKHLFQKLNNQTILGQIDNIELAI